MKKCLIIDDVEVSRYACRIFLEQMDFELAGVATEDEALRALSAGGFDVILLDWHLRKANGLELIGKIREQGTSKNTPIIIISGVEGQDKAPEAHKAGAVAFVAKPVDEEKLKTALKAAGIV